MTLENEKEERKGVRKQFISVLVIALILASTLGMTLIA